MRITKAMIDGIIKPEPARLVIPEELYADPRIKTANERYVNLWLWCMITSRGVCRLSAEEIGGKLGIRTDSVIKALDRLQSLGFITIDNGAISIKTIQKSTE